MDMHTVWNRLDHLERLVLSQAKEIDTLKRNLNRYDTHPSREWEDPNHHHHYNHHHHHHQNGHVHRYSRNYSSTRRDCSPPHRQTYHPYQMNSFVHPPSAIPPGASAQQVNGRPHPRLPPRVSTTPPLPPSSASKKRWSAAPNLGPTSDDMLTDDVSDSQDFNESQSKRHQRQGFVEPTSSSSKEAPRKKPAAELLPQNVAPKPADSDEEEIDVENLDSSGSSFELVLSSVESSSPTLDVALVEKKGDKKSKIELKDDSDSDVEEIAVIPRRRSLVDCKPLNNQVANYKPGADKPSDTSDMKKPNQQAINAKKFSKSVPKRLKPRSNEEDSPDQDWIWNKGCSSGSRPSLPAELKDIIQKSPF